MTDGLNVKYDQLTRHMDIELRMFDKVSRDEMESALAGSPEFWALVTECDSVEMGFGCYTVDSASVILDFIHRVNARHLKLTYMKMGNQDFTELTTRMPLNLHRLDLTASRLTGDMIIKLAGLLPASLTVLDLSHIHINSVGIHTLAAAIKRLNLVELAMNKVGMSPKGFAAIAAALSPNIEVLNVGSNGLGVMGLTTILAYMPTWNRLRTLDWSGNSLRDLTAFSDVVRLHPALQTLDVGGNYKLQWEGVLEFTKVALAGHYTFNYMNLHGSGLNHPQRGVIEYIIAALHSKKSKALVVLTSARMVPRLAPRSLPLDMLRLIAKML